MFMYLSECQTQKRVILVKRRNNVPLHSIIIATFKDQNIVFREAIGVREAWEDYHELQARLGYVSGSRTA